MVASIVVIPSLYTCRGITFLPGTNQQYTGPVPPGEYDVIGEAEVTYSDLGRAKTTTACLIVNIANGEKWWVGLQVGDWLLSEHKRPPATHPE